MFARYAFRMGFIAVLALTIFAIGKFANFVTGTAPADTDIPFQATELDAPLDDPVMHSALEEYRRRHGTASGNLTFPSPEGPVELSASDVHSLNQRYAQMLAHEERMAAIAQQSETIRREQMDDAGWGDDSTF